MGPDLADQARWIGHATDRLSVGAAEYQDRSFALPLAVLLDELLEEGADVGCWAAIMHCVVQTRPGIPPDEQQILSQRLREIAAAGAHAWKLTQHMAEYTAVLEATVEQQP